MKNQEQIIDYKYDAYYRKSLEAEDRQIQSIDDQKRELKEYALKNNLNVVGEFEESQSAHQLGRPVFDEVMKRIEKGTSNALLVWHANRTSRNPIDSGRIINLIDQGKLIHVRTPSHIYGNSSTEKMMLALECMIAKKDSDDKSDAVKRGLRGRYKKGLPNGVAPIGFMNDLSKEKGDRGWLVDEEKLPIIKQLLDLFLTGRYSIRSLLKIANEEMGLRTTLHKKQGGRKLVLSHLTDTILKNPVFAGFFYTKDGERHELSENIPRLITEEQHWEIKKILGDKSRPRASTNRTAFAYPGHIKCGGCGGSVTAEHKYSVICDCKKKFSHLNKTHCPRCGIKKEDIKKPIYFHYIHYHCTRKKNPNCHEGSIQELYIDDQLATYYKENLKISQALHDWCIENLEDLGANDVKNDSEKKVSLEATLVKKKNEYKELVLMKTRGLISDSEFMELKIAQKHEIEALECKLNNTSKKDQTVNNKAHRAFSLALGIDEVFKNGTVPEKKELLSELGSKLTLKDRKLCIYSVGIYERIINGLLSAKSKNSRFEPEKIFDTSSQNSDFLLVRSTLLRG